MYPGMLLRFFEFLFEPSSGLDKVSVAHDSVLLKCRPPASPQVTHPALVFQAMIVACDERVLRVILSFLNTSFRDSML